MADAVIVSTARTAIGTAFKGSLVDVDALELGTQAVGRGRRAARGSTPSLFDDVVLGETLYGGGDIARYAAIEAGLEHVPGVAQNRHCASGLTAVHDRGRLDPRRHGPGGRRRRRRSRSRPSPRSTRRVPGTDEWDDWMSPSHRDTPDAPNLDMSITVGWNAAVEAGVTREEMDAWALRSHQRAIAAIDEGSFDEEIFPVEVTGPRRHDAHVRRRRAPAAGHEHGEAGVAQAAAPRDRGLQHHGRQRRPASTTAPPPWWSPTGRRRGRRPRAARHRAGVGLGRRAARAHRAGARRSPSPRRSTGPALAIGDVDLWEINEAFASMCVATTRILGIDEEIVNVLGSGCSLGHPIAMTGARMVISLVHELRRRGGGTGVAAMCAGGGMSTAVVLDVPAP